MRWFFGARQLHRLGILGINRRNANCILDRNPRSRFPIVDDKLLMAELCRRIGVPSPAIFGNLSHHGELKQLDGLLKGRQDFVIKPARGCGGRGVLVVTKREKNAFHLANGRIVDFDGLVAHGSDVLSGMFSLGGRPDRLILQQRVRPHSAFAPIAPQGVADIRILVYRFEPAMAMLRLPTLASVGRANLQQGGVGVGIDLQTGLTRHAVYRNRPVKLHPDTGEPVLNVPIPSWERFVAMSRQVARAVGLGFVGIDLVLDEELGPLLLEANARPGLTIQLANERGLAHAIDAIDEQLDGSR